MALCGALLVLATACQEPGRSSTESAGQVKSYVPLYRGADDRRADRGTVRGDFQWAADAPTLEEAALRWRSFLEAHNPPGQEFEDGFSASYVRAAQYELVRVHYLRGRREEGDAILRRLDPVGWEQ